MQRAVLEKKQARSGRLERLLAKLGVSLALTLLLVECGSAAVIYAGVIPSRLPSFEIPHRQEPFFIDIDPHFGAWHPPNRSVGHRRACFDVTYYSNSYGALDVERSRHADRARAVVLGDSFAAGHGVMAKDRFSNRLEALTGIPHLNFGVGGTGPTQYFMVYKHMARQFDHEYVLVSILPDNDFFEGGSSRYAPYWDGEYPNYTLRYTLPRLEASEYYPSRQNTEVTAHDVLGSFSFFYNAADWVVGARKVLHRRSNAPNYAGYFDFTEKQFLRMRQSLVALTELVPEGHLTVMGIPRLIDLVRYKEVGKNPFGDKMKRSATELGFKYVDMLPPMAEAFAGHERDLYLGCDGHWAPKGHDFAARTLQRMGYPWQGSEEPARQEGTPSLSAQVSAK